MFSERDIETVVELVLDLPVISNLLGETLRAGSMTRDVVGALKRKTIRDSDSLDSHDGLQVLLGGTVLVGELPRWASRGRRALRRVRAHDPLN